MTKAEKRKRNYNLVINAFHNVDLARKSRHWGDARLKEELGLRITKKVPKRREIKSDRQSYYDRKLRKLEYGKRVGLTAEESLELTKYKDSKILATKDYRDLSKRKNTTANRVKRINMWESWSKDENRNMPPEIKALAIEINRNTKIRKHTLDDTDKYGYVVAYYMIVENQSKEYIMNNVAKPDPFDSYKVLYTSMIKAV